MGEIKKAIMDLQEYIGSGEYNGSNPPIYLNTANLAISALEKQIPKKPSFIDSEIFECPNCRWKRSISNIHFCPTCGQSIDWRNEDE